MRARLFLTGTLLWASSLPSAAIAQGDLSRGLQAIDLTLQFPTPLVTALSGDGQVFGGWSLAPGGTPLPFTWRAEHGAQLSDVTGGAGATLLALSRDGQRAAGQMGRHAVLWSPDAGPRDLGVLNTGLDWSEARGISGNGAVVVGTSHYGGGAALNDPILSRAFRWTEAGGMVSLGTLRGQASSHATATNGDGAVVVGWSDVPQGSICVCITNVVFPELVTLGAESGARLSEPVWGGGLSEPVLDAPVAVIADDPAPDLRQPLSPSAPRAFRWTAAGGMVDLGLAAPEDEESYALGVSADGAAVVGQSGRFAMRWTQRGGMQHLGRLTAGDTESQALDASADGAVIAGWARTGSGQRAFRWTEAQGLQDLGLLDGASGMRAIAISDDGQVIAGDAFYDGADRRAFVWRADRLVDQTNTAADVVQGAAQQMQAVQTVASLTSAAFGDLPPAPGGDAVLSTSGAAVPVSLRFGVAQATGGDDLSARLATVEVQAALPSGLGVTALLGAQAGRDALRGTGLRGGLTLAGLSLQGPLGGPMGGSGLRWRAALSGTGGTVSLSRPAALPNTEAGQGDAALTSRSALIELSRVFERGAWTLTPHIGLTHMQTRRSAYTETRGAAFPIRYDGYSEDATVLSLGLQAGLPLSPRGVLTLSAGAAHDLDRSARALTGTSTIPGLGAFSLAPQEVLNRTRLRAGLGYAHQTARGVWDISLQAAQAPYSRTPTVTVATGWRVAF